MKTADLLIAERTGWKNVSYCGQEFGWLGDSPYGREQVSVPHFTESLDDMQEAIATLSEDQRITYYCKLVVLCGGSFIEAAFAEADQKAAAFIHTTNPEPKKQ